MQNNVQEERKVRVYETLSGGAFRALINKYKALLQLIFQESSYILAVNLAELTSTELGFNIRNEDAFTKVSLFQSVPQTAEEAEPFFKDALNRLRTVFAKWAESPLFPKELKNLFPFYFIKRREGVAAMPVKIGTMDIIPYWSFYLQVELYVNENRTEWAVLAAEHLTLHIGINGQMIGLDYVHIPVKSIEMETQYLLALAPEYKPPIVATEQDKQLPTILDRKSVV